jgi:proteasome lid subunit RPN8/RPN11
LDTLKKVPAAGYPNAIIIHRVDWEKMRADVSQRSPEEACGMLGGRIEGGAYETLLVIPATNMLHSPARYRIDPQEQLAAFMTFEAQGLELVGIYHSHPQGPAYPSPTDIAEAYYPEVIYLIWVKQGDKWSCSGFTIRAGRVQTAVLDMVESGV